MNRTTRDDRKVAKDGHPWYTSETVKILRDYYAYYPRVDDLERWLEGQSIVPLRVHVNHGNRPTNTCFLYYWIEGNCWFIQSFKTIVRAVMRVRGTNAALVFDTWDGSSRTTSKHIGAAMTGVHFSNYVDMPGVTDLREIVNKIKEDINDINRRNDALA